MEPVQDESFHTVPEKVVENESPFILIEYL